MRIAILLTAITLTVITFKVKNSRWKLGFSLVSLCLYVTSLTLSIVATTE